jgi:hypothetical protein
MGAAIDGSLVRDAGEIERIVGEVQVSTDRESAGATAVRP